MTDPYVEALVELSIINIGKGGVATVERARELFVPRESLKMKFMILTDAQDNSHVYVNVAFIRSFVRDGDHTTVIMGEELIYWVKEPAETIADFLKEMGIDIPVWIGA